MSQIGAISFDCGGTLIDSEAICPRAYITMFQEFDIALNSEEVFRRFKGVKLYETIDTVPLKHGVMSAKTEAEHVYRAEVVRLFDSELEAVEGIGAFLSAITAPMCVVSNGPDNKMRHFIGKLNMLHCFPDKLFSGYDIQCWKPDPALMFHTTEAMDVNVENRIPVDDSATGTQSGTDAGMGVFYFCADPHNKPIVHPGATTFTHLPQLPELRRARGWDIMAQFFTLPSLTPPKLMLRGK